MNNVVKIICIYHEIYRISYIEHPPSFKHPFPISAHANLKKINKSAHPFDVFMGLSAKLSDFYVY